MPQSHDHDHSHLHPMGIRVRALETLLTRKAYVDPGAPEQLMVTRGVAIAELLHALEHAWVQAAKHRPHSQPIVLPSEPGEAHWSTA